MLGSVALGLPVILLGVAVLLMRTDPDPETRPRTVVGALLLGLGVLGVWHLSVGAPPLLDGRQAGGGVIGAWVADPLTFGVTVWLAMPVLVLVAAFGLLVLTGTPVRDVPRRVQCLITGEAFDEEYDDEWGSAEDVDEEPVAATEVIEKPKRKRKKAAEEVVEPTDDDAAAHPARHREHGDAPVMEPEPEVVVGKPRAAGGARAPAQAAPRPGRPGARDAADRRGDRDRPARGGLLLQPPRAARGRGRLPPAPARPADRGRPAEGPLAPRTTP